MENSGFVMGAFDICIRPNDGKTVWRNFERVRFEFCPFCGHHAIPSPEKLRKMWDLERNRKLLFYTER
jgi:hypothetical protein